MELDVSTPPPRNSRTAWAQLSAPLLATASAPPHSSSSATSACIAPRSSCSGDTSGGAVGIRPGDNRDTQAQKRIRSRSERSRGGATMARCRYKTARSR
jgi:hypothetical protein